MIVPSASVALAQVDLSPNASSGKYYEKGLKLAQFTTQMQNFVSKSASKNLVVKRLL